MQQSAKIVEAGLRILGAASILDLGSWSNIACGRRNEQRHGIHWVVAPWLYILRIAFWAAIRFKRSGAVVSVLGS